ncbi:uncharacterized protein LOC144444494 isoform X2 [Glandiceps talaboti]
MALPLINTSVPYDTEKPVVRVATAKTSAPIENVDVGTEDLKSGDDLLLHRLPTIVSLQDTGKPELYKSDVLDTNFQKAIRRAKERMARGECPCEPEEWRLPGAPLPARPDYTRTCPNLGRPPFLRTRGKLGSKGTDDRTAITQSAPANISTSDGHTYFPPLTEGYLQTVTSYPTLYPYPSMDLKSIGRLPQPKVYLPFVDNAMLHPKFVTAVEIRDKQYVVPEFCYGCRAFVDPSHEHPTPTIDNWTTDDGDINLPPGLCYACALSHVPHFHHERPVRVGGGFTFYKRDRPIDFGIRSVPASRRNDIPAPTLVCYDVPEPQEERGVVSVSKLREPTTPLRPPTTPREVPPRVPQFIKDKQNNENAKPRIYEALDDYNKNQPADMSSESGLGTSIQTQDVQRYFQMIQEREEEPVQPTPTPEPRTPPPEKPRLWKAPKAFTLKKAEKKITEAKDPFSDDRDLNLPKYKGFELKKSDKAVTVPVDFERGKADYTPPKKWEPKKPEPKPATIPIERPERTEKLYTAPPPPKPRPKKAPPPPPPPPPKPKPPPKEPPPKKEKPIVIPKPRTPTPEPRSETPDSGVESVPPEPPKKVTPKPRTPTPPPPPKEPTPPPPTPPPPPKEPTPEPEPEPEPTPPPPPKEPTPEPTPPPPKSPTPPPPPPPPPVQKKKREPPPPKKKIEKPKRVKPVPKPKVEEVKEVKPPTPPPIEKEPEPEPEPPKPPTPVPIEIPPLPPAPETPPPPPPKTPTPEPEPEPEPEPRIPTPTIEPEKLPPPPKVKASIKWKRRPPKRKWKRMGEPTPIPKTDESTERFKDPLDYLAKYCIVHKERLPAYQRVFNTVLKKKGYRPDQLLPMDQPPVPVPGKKLSVRGGHRRPSGLQSDSGSEDSGYSSSRAVASDKEDDTIKGTFAQSNTVPEEGEDGYVSPMKITFSKPPDEDERGDGAESPTSDLGTLSRSSSFVGSTSFDADEQVGRVKYILDTNREKVANLKNKVQTLESQRIRIIAKAAREEFPQILREDYEPPVKKEKGGKKGKKKDKSQKGHSHSPGGTVRFMTDDRSVPTAMGIHQGQIVDEKPKYNPSSDAFVISRLDKDKLAMLETISEVEKIDLEMGRSIEKLEYAEKRIMELHEEGSVSLKILEQLERVEDEKRLAKSPDFRRKQSPKYQKMNPVSDVQMGIEEVEPALRQINGYLITEKECEYVYHVLDLPQRSKINFKLFTVVAALSEKVSRLDPFVRKLINKLDFEALDVKLEYAKELFRLLANEEEDQDFGPGEVSIRNLAIECAAGGIAKHNTQFIVDKFNREGKNYVDFLDYLTYIPLFIEIHENICKDPLASDRTR